MQQLLGEIVKVCVMHEISDGTEFSLYPPPKKPQLTQKDLCLCALKFWVVNVPFSALSQRWQQRWSFKESQWGHGPEVLQPRLYLPSLSRRLSAPWAVDIMESRRRVLFPELVTAEMIWRAKQRWFELQENVAGAVSA